MPTKRGDTFWSPCRRLIPLNRTLTTLHTPNNRVFASYTKYFLWSLHVYRLFFARLFLHFEFEPKICWQIVCCISCLILKCSVRAILRQVVLTNQFAIPCKVWGIKVHIFWEGQRILRNLHLTFDWHYKRQSKVKISRNFLAFIWTLSTYHKCKYLYNVKLYFGLFHE